MRKTGKIKLFLIILLIVAALGAVGCGESDHTHTFSEFWAYDSAQHWQPSTCNHNAKRSLAAHEFTQSVTLPDESSGGYTTYSCLCGYSYIDNRVDPLPGEETELRFDENGHWKSVAGENEPDVKPHDFADEITEPTCATYGYTKHTCRECAYWVIDTPVNPTAHDIVNDMWAHNSQLHWKFCLNCGCKFESTAHDFTESTVEATCDTDGYTQFDCADCGYSYRGRIVEKHHTYSNNEFLSDEYNHWLKPVCGHDDASRYEAEEHILMGRSNVCEICKQAVAERLGYQLSSDGSYYSVVDIGCVTSSTVVIPSEYRNIPVKVILPRAFEGENITGVTIPSGITEIGASAFAGCAITELTIPDTVVTIGTRAFEKTKITSLGLPASLQSLGNGICLDCTDLQTVTLNCNLDVIAPYTFQGCENLTTVTATHNPTQISALAFSGCKKLISFDISDCTNIGFAAFDGCAAFAPAIPAALAELDEYAFGGTKLTSAVLPASLISLSNYAFDGCTSLTTVTVNSAIIGKYAFGGCTSLTSVTLSGTQRINEYAFGGCSVLSSLTLPSTVIEVGENAFDGTALVTVSDNLKIAAGVVVGTTDKNITSATVPANVVGIADNAFRDCTKLSGITLGGVRFIGKSAFRNTEALKSVTFTESVKYIGANAFRESGLTSVTIPATVDSVGDNAFYDCKSLTSANINAKVIGKFAFSYTGVDRELNSPIKKRPAYATLANVILGDNVDTIGSNAFQYCPITALTLPSDLKSIGKYAFAKTDITSVTIPASVVYVGEYAFYDTKLNSVTLSNKQGWKAGSNSINANASASSVASLLTKASSNGGYMDYDWVRE